MCIGSRTFWAERLLHENAAASETEASGRTGRVARKPARLDTGIATALATAPRAASASATHAAGSTGARETVRRDLRLAEAELAAPTFVQAVPRRRAGSAELRILKVIEGARTFVTDERAEEDVVAVELREGAATEAIAAVRCEHATSLIAALRLRGRADVRLYTRGRGVGAPVLGIERIALTVPLTLAATRAVAAIEVAIGVALVAGLAGRPGQKDRALRAVARTEALRILMIHEAIVVVVDAVATGVGVAVGTQSRKAARARTAARATSRGATGGVPRASSGAEHASEAGRAGRTAAPAIAASGLVRVIASAPEEHQRERKHN